MPTIGKSYGFQNYSAFSFRGYLGDRLTRANVFKTSTMANNRRTDMMTFSAFKRVTFRASAAAFGMAAFMGLAAAGECPADKVKEGARTSGETKPVGVTDTVIASIDLAPKGGDFEGQLLRMRKLTIEPGGIVPWHEHSARPANIYILSGTIEEYRANCEVPIVHKAGEVAQEFGKGFAHWWKNTSTEPVVLISADIFMPAKMDKDMM
jgi:quercetin dioxygenase-like cupin family protein